MPESIAQKINSIIERNRRVEADKAWETSTARRAIIFIFTYLLVLYFLLLINAPNPYLNALVPAIAYVVSTMSLPFIKNLWAEKFTRRRWQATVSAVGCDLPVCDWQWLAWASPLFCSLSF